MASDLRTSEPTNRGATGFKTIALFFAGILVLLVLAGIWATSEMDEKSGPPPTTTAPK
jgi:hypothetical protein